MFRVARALCECWLRTCTRDRASAVANQPWRFVFRTPPFRYVADDTPMLSYMNTHTVLNNRRQEALQAGKRGPHVIVLGPTDSGKSTLTRMLCNWAVRSGWQPTMVDLDVGEPRAQHGQG